MGEATLKKCTKEMDSGPRNWGGAPSEGFGGGESETGRNGRMGIIPGGGNMSTKAQDEISAQFARGLWLDKG